MSLKYKESEVSLLTKLVKDILLEMHEPSHRETERNSKYLMPAENANIKQYKKLF